MDVATTEAGGVDYILYEQTATREIQALLWYLYEHESAGTAVVLTRKVLRFLVVGKKNGVILVLGFLGPFKNYVRF